MRRVALLLLLPADAWAAGAGAVDENLLWLAQKLGFPAVLGELLLGVLLGTLSLFGLHYFDDVAKDPIIAFLAELSEAMFSVIIIMVILTTLLTPPVLTALLRREKK